MPSWKKPTPEEIDRAVALLGHPEYYRYFFDKLGNPEWIAPLRSKGFFSNPPPVRVDETQRTIATPPWPESRYLSRMASLTPELVLEVILKIPATKNTSIHEDLIEAALAMPPNLAAKLTPKIKEWINAPRVAVRPDKLGALISLLARGGQISEAIDLARTVLAVIPGDEITVGLPAGTYRSRRDPGARFDNWYYGEILKKNVPDLVDAAGEEAFELLCDLLHTAVRFRRATGEVIEPEDYSYIWRRAIEDHGQNQSFGMLGLIISAVRDAAERIAKSDRTKVQNLVSRLENRRWHVFQRLALHLLRLFPDPAFPMIVNRLTNRELFDSTTLRHEYVLLLRSQFAKLRPEEQAKILDWIEKGPNTERFLQNQTELGEKEPSEEEIKKHVRWWQLDRLAPLREVLDTKWQRRYEDLVSEFGEPEHPEFVSYSTSWVGPTSPKNAEELRAMSVDQLIEFLKGWNPPEDPWSPSPEGLGRVLIDVIASEPERYAQESERFRDIHPTYVRSVFSGLRNAIGQKRAFSWPPVLQLCRWAIEQARDGSATPSRHLERDPHWGWARKSIAELLESGFGDGVTEIPFDLRETVWNIIKAITDDPEPDQNYEAQYGGSNMDPATMSINTTRGEGMHAVVRYALWVRRHMETSENAHARLSRGFDEMPEVRQVLDAHLNIQEDPSLAIRSVYGRWFPWLLLLDPNWVRSKISDIFPVEESLQKYFEAAWNTYVVFCPPYDNVFEVLESIYAHAIDQLSAMADIESRVDDPDHHLGQHLMTYYWRGKLSLDDNGLLARFWQKANRNVRSHAIEFVGRSLSNTNNDVPPEIAARFKKLWATRLTIAKRSTNIAAYQDELAAFGWWFRAAKLGYEWEIAQLKEVLLLVHKIDPESMVAERLVDLAGRSPKDVIECLRLLVETTEQPWGIYAWRDEAKKIVATVIQSPNAQARDEGIRLVHQLGSMGHLEFRELLPATKPLD
jgi:hypothetical protein